MRTLAKVVAVLVAAAVVIALGAVGFAFSGIFDVSAVTPHNPIAYWLIHETALNSVQHRAKGIAVPDLSQPELIEQGFGLFQHHCVQCHGAPGVPRADFARGLAPEAPPLMQVSRQWQPAELFWTIQHGIKMTGMPAWEYRLSRDQTWAIVAFVHKLKEISPTDYQKMAAKEGQNLTSSRPPEGEERTAVPEQRARGKLALLQYSCDSCHDIPGIPGFGSHLAPPLAGVGGRRFIAGVLANTPENMIRWISDPQEVKPGTAMPDMGVSPEHAREIVAYLDALQ